MNAAVELSVQLLEAVAECAQATTRSVLVVVLVTAIFAAILLLEET
jgi:hypothetical protein